MDSKKNIARLIATAAAVAFVSAPVLTTSAFAAHKHKKVPCYGVNSCKGKSKCKTANNACKGQNTCKGKGVVMKTPKQCKKLGGTLEEAK